MVFSSVSLGFFLSWYADDSVKGVVWPYVYSYDGRGQWVGNDSYRSYIRLAKGHNAKELKPYVNKMRQDHFPLKEMKNMGVELNYDFTVLSDVYTQDPYIKKMGWIMCIMAFVLLFYFGDELSAYHRGQFGKPFARNGCPQVLWCRT